MTAPEHPANESERRGDLVRLGVLDTPPEERFDRVTRLAARLLDVPIALVSLVDSNRQWFKSRQGLYATETPRDISFCGHAILGTDPFVVEDASEDPRFRDNPLVAGAPDIRFYAGRPLRGPSGLPMGTLCVIDTQPRSPTDADLALLDDLAKMVEGELAALHAASTDPLTGLSNRAGFHALAHRALDRSRLLERELALLYIDLDGFKPINDTYGHAEGDRALCEVAALLQDVFRDGDVIARMGGDEFCVLAHVPASLPATALEDRIRDALDARNAARTTAYALRASVGSVRVDPRHHATLCSVLDDADRRMYQAKRAA